MAKSESSKKRVNKNHLFKPGQSGNPGGRTPLPPDIKEMRKAGAEHLIFLYHHAAMGTLVPQTPIERGMCKVLDDFAKTGDTSQIRHVWDRALGKPLEQMQVDSNVENVGVVVVRYGAEDQD